MQPDPHPAHPLLPPGTMRVATQDEYRLLWSLSFATTAHTWRTIVETFGGFDTGYTGYGAEDTDFGQLLRAHRIPLVWRGGTHAFHQWHPVSSPPVEHLEAIVRNAGRFHSRWGFWPMLGWLEQFREAGLAHVNEVDGRWVVSKKGR